MNWLMNLDIVQILGLGFTGLAFLLAYLSQILLWGELRKDPSRLSKLKEILAREFQREAPRTDALQAILVEPTRRDALAAILAYFFLCAR